MTFLCSGEVQVWDLGREDETLAATSGMESDSHREPVSKVRIYSFIYLLVNLLVY